MKKALGLETGLREDTVQRPSVSAVGVAKPAAPTRPGKAAARSADGLPPGAARGSVSRAKKNPSNQVTRFEVIDQWGRVYVRTKVKVELSYQDEGRTLKVFVEPRKAGGVSRRS